MFTDHGSQILQIDTFPWEPQGLQSIWRLDILKFALKTAQINNEKVAQSKTAIKPSPTDQMSSG